MSGGEEEVRKVRAEKRSEMDRRGTGEGGRKRGNRKKWR